MWYRGEYIRFIWWKGNTGAFEVEVNGKKETFDSMAEAKRYIDDLCVLG